MSAILALFKMTPVQRYAADSDVLRLLGVVSDVQTYNAHAPKGGATVGGKHFVGGEFIPAEVMAKATDAEKAAVQGKALPEKAKAEKAPDEPEDKAEGEPEKEEDEPWEWDGSINRNNVSRHGREEEELKEWDFYDDNGEHFPQTVFLVSAEYDPDPDGDHPDSEKQTVWRWESHQDGGGIDGEYGDWTASERDARRDGIAHARENHMEKPETEEEEKDEENYDDLQDAEAEILDKAAPPVKKAVALGDAPAPRSQAHIAISRKVGEAKADAVVNAVFAQDDTDDSYDRLAESLGMPDDASLTVVDAGPYDTLFGDDTPMKAVGVRVEVKHPKMGRVSRFVGIDADGKRFIKNEIIEINKGSQGDGLGRTIFAKQVEAAASEGIDYIVTHAAKASTMNGYYTWPRFGYDQDLDDARIKPADKPAFEAAKKRFPGAKTVLDVMATKEGRDWWKANGTDLHHAVFDLDENSRSMQTLRDYLAERSNKSV